MWGRHSIVVLRVGSSAAQQRCLPRKFVVAQFSQKRALSEVGGGSLNEPDEDVLASLVCPFTKASFEDRNLWYCLYSAVLSWFPLSCFL